MPARSDRPARTYHVLGVPLRTGSLMPGSEDDARAYRDAGLLERLHQAGCDAVDEGDLAVPSYLPHHTVPPFRNWPGPRIVWDLVTDRLDPHLERPGRVPLLIGCDCSIVVGTAQALIRATSPEDVHVLYVDGGFDDAPPAAERSQSGAAMASWLLTHESPFWVGPALRRSQVTVIGASEAPLSDSASEHSVSLARLREAGPREVARRVLRALPPSASILLHLDVDVLQQREMPAAYFPHPDGLTWAEAGDLLDVLLADPRLRLVEISEYASLRDGGRECIDRLVDYWQPA
jgi:arginase